MSDSEDKDIFEELIERKRYKIVKYINAQVFFDKLRENKVLSMDDTQEIASKPTRRQQAGICWQVKKYLHTHLIKIFKLQKSGIIITKCVHTWFPSRIFSGCLTNKGR